MGSQRGSFSPAFPPLIGAEQFPGFRQAQGFQPSIWPRPAYAWQMPSGMPTPYSQSPWIQAQAGYGATFAGVPERLSSWGAQVMGFGMRPRTDRGQGIRIVGSRSAAIHPDLVHRLAEGRDRASKDSLAGSHEEAAKPAPRGRRPRSETWSG